MDWWIDDSLPVGPMESPSFQQIAIESVIGTSAGDKVNIVFNGQDLRYSSYGTSTSTSGNAYVRYTNGGVV